MEGSRGVRVIKTDSAVKIVEKNKIPVLFFLLTIATLFAYYFRSISITGVIIPIVLSVSYSDELFFKAFRANPIPIIVSKLSGPILDVNESYLRFMGYRREEVIGHTAIELGMAVNPDDRPRVTKALSEQGSIQNLEVSIRTKSGKIRNVSSSLELIEVSGEPCILAMFYDITELKQMEHEILAAKEDAELYLDIIAHDINNLNQVSLGYLELLLKSKLEKKQRNYAEKSLSSVRKSIKLIENMHLLGQLKDISEFQDIDLNEVICAVIEEFSINPYKNVDFKYNPEAGLMVKADPLIKQIFVNFFDNSIKYSGGRVMIGIGVKEIVRENKKFYRVCVEDNGDGVPDEKKPFIFDRMERGTKKTKGRGLGLYIVKKLVEKYCGEVWVEDRVKGNYRTGARFCFTIPNKNQLK